MTMKTALLGAAAGLMTVGAAQAADLPMTKAEAVEYVKVCNEFGAGFYYIPGSDTCLKIGGEVRADYVYNEPTARSSNALTFNGRARTNFDARTATEYGTLRSFIQLDANLSSGSSSFSVDKAFIQLGGFTAGYATSFFNFYDAEYGNTYFAPYYAPANNASLLAYTAVFGGGFAATLSVQDQKSYGKGPSVPGVPVPVGVTGAGIVGGENVPDVIASIRYESGGIIAHAAIAGHEVRADHIGAAGGFPSSDYGFAVNAGIGAKYGAFFAAIEGNYADGATGYTGIGQVANPLAVSIADAAVVAKVGGGFDLKTVKSYSFTGDLGYDITPALTAHLVGSYAKYDAPTKTEWDFSSYAITGNLTYTVVPGLKVAGEVGYVNTSYGANGYTPATSGIAPRAKPAKQDTWLGGVRVVRNF